MTPSRSRSGPSLTALIVTALTAVLWFGCSDATVDPVTSPEASENFAEVDLQEIDLGPALAAQERATPGLMKRNGVVGTAVGLTEKGKPSLTIFLERAGVAELPDRVDDVPVEIVVTGRFYAGADPTTRARPAPAGFSIGHPDITAGTFGARVTDGTDVFALSNNHVLANSNDANIGDSALQPGPTDGGTDPEDSIGELFDFEVIDFENDNTMDAAIAISTTDELSASTPTDDAYGVPSSTVFNDGDGDGFFDDKSALLGTAVQKYGRTTGHTQGEITEINLTVSVCYAGFVRCTQSATFVDQMAIEPGSFSDGGDSGSLIVTDDENANPVGLLFAGSDTRTIANRIDLVLDRFGVTVDDGDGGGDDGGDDGGDTNSPPTASFTSACAELTCDFDGSGSSDSDGSITSHDWTFGDGAAASGETVSHTYAADGTYSVTLTVTDDAGATDSETQDVTVAASDDGGDGVTLTATGYKERGLHKADLEWEGATSTNVDIFRDGVLVQTTENDGFFTDHIDNRGSGSYTYQVCEEGTSTCSSEETVSI